MRARGYTLIELLVVISIIGTMSSIAVVSYSSVRASSRDVKRVSDLKQTQQSLELFFENNSYYPTDSVAGSEGVVLGTPETRALSDQGFAPDVKGTPYMITVPRNPEPGGSPYIYRSLHRDGTNCDDRTCDSYALLFTLEGHIGSYLAGPHAITPVGVVGAEGGYAGAGVTSAGGSIIGIQGVQALLSTYATDAAYGVSDFVSNSTVKTVSETVVAPAAAVATVANTTLAAQAFGSVGEYVLFFITQPVLLLGRRKRKAWGVAYNALSKLPEDLVIVRLRDAATGRVLQSTVTDNQGRYSFLVSQGAYRIEAAKGKLVFPSRELAAKKEDGQYLDLYHGELIEVGDKGALLTPNIPLDPEVEEVQDKTVLKADFWRGAQRFVALLGPTLGVIAFAIKPSVMTGVLVLIQVMMYFVFRRLAAGKKPGTWGIIYDEFSGKPVSRAVVRIFAMPYHKLLESQVTDRNGRYQFRVGNNIYYLTVSKEGFVKTETDPLDLTAAKEATAIASDLPLRKVGTIVASGKGE